MSISFRPKIYHIVHVDRLPSILSENRLWCDAEIVRRPRSGTTIGMNSIKQRRLKKSLDNHPDLCVGECVPFYFCPRSIMLYLIHCRNHSELSYRDGQNPIIHLEADLYQTVDWAEKHSLRWAFTLSNAGSLYFEDYCDLAHLEKIDWKAVQAKYWSQCKEGKQAEFLIEQEFAWELVSRIGVQSQQTYSRAVTALETIYYKPPVEIRHDWYY